jgi:hypothetical protein
MLLQGDCAQILLLHAQAQALNGSCDYFALNHYSTT